MRDTKYITGTLTSTSVDLKQLVMEHASPIYCVNTIQSSADMHFDQKKKWADKGAWRPSKPGRVLYIGQSHAPFG